VQRFGSTLPSCTKDRAQSMPDRSADGATAPRDTWRLAIERTEASTEQTRHDLPPAPGRAGQITAKRERCLPLPHV